MTERQIAALFVQEGGCYFDLPGVDPWPESRDARLYPGPWPVVAHPPCERWGRYWYGGPMLHKLGRRLKRGDDGGCFAAAITAIRRFGGVLEHPEASSAWSTFGLITPPRRGGWITAGDGLGWTCCVEQGWYGHRAAKATWLYTAHLPDLPSLQWGKSPARIRLDEGFHTKEEALAARARRREQRLGARARLSRSERSATPIAFRDLLISMARSAARDRIPQPP